MLEALAFEMGWVKLKCPATSWVSFPLLHPSVLMGSTSAPPPGVGNYGLRSHHT